MQKKDDFDDHWRMKIRQTIDKTSPIPIVLYIKAVLDMKQSWT